ncbi:Serine/threonine-protein kinase 16 [Ophiophagus hannah]|uniref:non-specific serine/threonine protein kinase n=1 Tax=Ophiophagus hannah TaxID=8665 RepID=V8P833_OPHHA|nr:Serine/threonine-protein kinase 16 [Ophiophagus hannah]
MGHALCICSRGTITINNKRYLLIHRLGEGGFSYVDLVEGLQDGRFYALKRIICHDKDDRQEALHEVEMHLLFEHPNILPLCAHAMVEKGSKHEAWLLLPFLKVSSLQTNFLVKGDLKPTNVLLDNEDQPLLMDLGSMNQACIEVRSSREAMTIQDWAAQRCTISYRAPELFNVERECVIDERTDIWSLGCVLYCMMFGEGPYDMIFQKGDSVALAVQNHLTVPPNTRYSPALEHLLSSTMVVNPQERPFVSDIICQLEAIQPPLTGQDATRI